MQTKNNLDSLTNDRSQHFQPTDNLKFNKLIWNITKICPWDCKFCCVDAYQITQSKCKLLIRKKGLKVTTAYTRNLSKNRYDDAYSRLKKEDLELSYFEKMKILNHIDFPVAIDFSGGDPLVISENFEIIKKARRKLGRKNISVTTTAVGLSFVKLDELAECTNSVDFTYDYSGDKGVPYRMDAYNASNLMKIKELKNYKATVTAQIPITKANAKYDMIKKIYSDLLAVNVDNILLMKLLPVGRGKNLGPSEIPSLEEEKYTIETYKFFESKYSGPKVNAQSVLKNSLRNIKGVYSTSLNISSQGMLLSSPWAYDEVGNPMNKYIIGDMKYNSLSTLLQTLKNAA